MLLTYKARGIDGELSQGVLEAESVREAYTKLRQGGLFALSIDRHVRLIRPMWYPRRQKLSRAQLYFLTTQMGFLLRSGLDLSQSIVAVASEARDPLLRDALNRVDEDIRNGCSFSAALLAQQEIFGETFAATIAAGEQSGKLAEVLDRLRDYLEQDLQLQHALQAAMVYPLMLMVVICGVLLGLFLFVLPQFASIFDQMGRVPPLLTQWLLSVSDGIRQTWPTLLTSVILAVFVVSWFRKVPGVRQWQHRFVLTSQLTKGSMQPLLAGRSFRLLGMILQSGIPMVTALKLSRHAIGNMALKDMYRQLEEDVLSGQPLSSRLGQFDFLPPGLAALVFSAERSGELGNVFQSVGEHYERQGQRQLRFAVRLLEPVMLVILGASAFVVLAAVILPLLDLTTAR